MALDEGYEYGVEVAGIGFIDVEITTPWGQPVHITGNITRLTGEPVAFTKVEIMISKDGSMFPEASIWRYTSTYE